MYPYLLFVILETLDVVSGQVDLALLADGDLQDLLALGALDVKVVIWKQSLLLGFERALSLALS